MAAARVAILGGGLAGLAAALRLAESGYSVELFEKRAMLGGRASSFNVPDEPAPIDNCQHVLLGCCTNLLDFFHRAGVGDRFRFYSRYAFVGPNESAASACSLSAAPLPAPLHLFPSLLRFRVLPWKDRIGVARALATIFWMPRPFPDEPLETWLDRHGQSATARQNFWGAVLTSALNESLDRISTRAAFQVFDESFLRNRRGYRMGVPTVSLGELYSSGAWSNRCELRLSAPAVSLEVTGNRVTAICLQTGERKIADFYISSLPADALATLVPVEQRASWPDLERWRSLEWSPITGIHLWFDRPIMAVDHVTICGRTIQWVFNKSAITAKTGSAASGPQYVQLVISASRSLMTLRREQILELVLSELTELFPTCKEAQLQRSVVVRELKSTPSFLPGMDALRPGTDTPFENLFLAGDWTASGWPPTMEGAVRSGYGAAERVTRADGNPQQFQVADLRADILPRYLQRSSHFPQGGHQVIESKPR